MAQPEGQLASIPRRIVARLVDLAVMFVPAITSTIAIRSEALGFSVFVLLLLGGAAQDILGTAR